MTGNLLHLGRDLMLPQNRAVKKYAFLILILWLMVPNVVQGQLTESRELYLEAERLFVAEEYDEALPLYMQLYEEDTGNDDLQYKIGVCFLNDPYQLQRAITFLEDASRGLRKDYKEYSFRERRAPQEAVYALARAYLAAEMPEKAFDTFEAFLIIMDKEVYDRDLVLWQMKACETAQAMMTSPIRMERILLDSTINSTAPELRPVVSGDGSTLVFVRQLPQGDLAYLCKRTEEGWSQPCVINPDLGFESDIYPTSLSFDGSEMILYFDDDRIGNLYYSRLVNGHWSRATLLEEPVSTSFWESHGCLTNGGNTLWFTSNREGSLGGLDIYVSQKNREGQWGEPVNLGPVINSPYNEDSPWISEDGETLYFSSFGHPTMGGYDIFVTRKDAAGNWDQPVNLGYPANSTRDDLYFQPLGNGGRAFHSLFLEGVSKKHDIFTIRWDPKQPIAPLTR